MRSEERIRQRLREVFQQYDVNRNGVVETSELEEMLRALGHHNEAWVREEIGEISKNGDGELTLDAFLAWSVRGARRSRAPVFARAAAERAA